MAASLKHLVKDNIIIVQGTIFVTPDPSQSLLNTTKYKELCPFQETALCN